MSKLMHRNAGIELDKERQIVLVNFITLWKSIESGCGPTLSWQQWNKAHITHTLYPQVEQRRKGRKFEVHV